MSSAGFKPLLTPGLSITCPCSHHPLNSGCLSCHRPPICALQLFQTKEDTRQLRQLKQLGGDAYNDYVVRPRFFLDAIFFFLTVVPIFCLAARGTYRWGYIYPSTCFKAIYPSTYVQYIKANGFHGGMLGLSAVTYRTSLGLLSIRMARTATSVPYVAHADDARFSNFQRRPVLCASYD